MIHSRKEVITIERTVTRLIALLLAFSVIEFVGNTLAATKVEEVTGEIVSVDLTANMLTIKTKKEEMNIHVTEKTQITMGKEQKQLSDLKPGEKVKAHYTISNGKDLAERVMVKAIKRK
jgi:Cu/Ag efflux protein CusF